MSYFRGLEFDPAVRRQLAVVLIAFTIAVVLAVVGGALFLAIRHPRLLLALVGLIVLAVLVRGGRRWLVERGSAGPS